MHTHTYACALHTHIATNQSSNTRCFAKKPWALLDIPLIAAAGLIDMRGLSWLSYAKLRLQVTSNYHLSWSGAGPHGLLTLRLKRLKQSRSAKADPSRVLELGFGPLMAGDFV